MDPIAIGIIAVVACGLAWFFIFKEDEDLPESKPNYNPTLTPEQQTEAKATIEKAKTEFASKLPTKAQLEKLTKAKLEELGRDMGVELDKRKTKANMIADLKAGVKK